MVHLQQIHFTKKILEQYLYYFIQPFKLLQENQLRLASENNELLSQKLAHLEKKNNPSAHDLMSMKSLENQVDRVKQVFFKLFIQMRLQVIKYLFSHYLPKK